jgi:hypothetical protein
MSMTVLEAAGNKVEAGKKRVYACSGKGNLPPEQLKEWWAKR